MLFNSYLTPTFGEVWPSSTDFANDYAASPFPDRLLTTDSEFDYSKYGIDTIYALLCANYMNDHIAPVDRDRFKLMVFSIIYEAGPAWQRAMAIQDRLLSMGDTLIFKGSKQHSSHNVDWVKQDQNLGNVAQHPDTDAANISDTNDFGDKFINSGGARSEKVLPYISEQRTGYSKGHTNDSGSNDTEWTKDNVKGLVELLYSLDDTACSRFVYRFKKLFQKIYHGGMPVMYGTEVDDNG